MQATFSNHALSRVEQRLNLSRRAVEELLERDLFVPVGVEPRGQREHRLFYSAPDKQCFVAIQDIRRGLVITVLPLDYHANICWQVSTDAQKLAMKIVSGSYSVPRFSVNDDIYPTGAVDVGPVTYRVSASLTNHYGNYLRSVSLGKWTFNGDPEALKNDEAFREEIKAKLETKISALPEPAYLSCLTLRKGKSSDMVVFDASEIYL